eukprot:SAG11_NODE_2626_length_3163_cov_1.351175_3_plen_178_part_00
MALHRSIDHNHHLAGRPSHSSVGSGRARCLIVRKQLGGATSAAANAQTRGRLALQERHRVLKRQQVLPPTQHLSPSLCMPAPHCVSLALSRAPQDDLQAAAARKHAAAQRAAEAAELEAAAEAEAAQLRALPMSELLRLCEGAGIEPGSRQSCANSLHSLLRRPHRLSPTHAASSTG